MPEVNSREVPKWMEDEDIAAVVAGFAPRPTLAVEAGCDGVEVNAGQHSLVRQFLSGLTNQRGDEWGTDRLRFARDVLAAVRRGGRRRRVVGLRLSCDELAPWAGITPGAGARRSRPRSPSCVDYLVVVRGSIFSVEQTRPDFHEPPGFNLDAVPGRSAPPSPERVAVVRCRARSSTSARPSGRSPTACATRVEMTRAQIADPDLVAKLAAARPSASGPCIRCNQTCQVRDARNPIVTCVGEPTPATRRDGPRLVRPARPRRRRSLVVGGGPAGLECARVAAARGHGVRVVERGEPTSGGVARAVAGPGGCRSSAGWPPSAGASASRSRLGDDVGADDLAAASDGADAVVLCTGRPTGRAATYDGGGGRDRARRPRRAARLRRCRGGAASRRVWDPIGGPIGVALAEELGAGEPCSSRPTTSPATS